MRALMAMLDPQLSAALARHQAILAELGPPGATVQEQRQHFLAARAWWNDGGPRLAVDRDETVPLPGGRSLRAAVYAAEVCGAPRPGFVYLHGGSFRFGAARSNDRQLRELAAAWGGVVVSLDYAHLPEAAFPVAVEETAAALQWLHAHAGSWGIAPDQIAAGGTSAGASVAMGAAVQLGLDRCGFLRALACIVGVFDSELHTASMQAYGDLPLMPDREGARTMFAAYLGDDRLRDDPRFRTVSAELAHMPPLFLAAAEIDVFRDSTVALAARAQESGSTVQLEVYAGMSHLFWGYSRMVDAAQACTRDIAEFLRAQLPGPYRAASPT